MARVEKKNIKNEAFDYGGRRKQTADMIKDHVDELMLTTPVVKISHRELVIALRKAGFTAATKNDVQLALCSDEFGERDAVSRSDKKGIAIFGSVDVQLAVVSAGSRNRTRHIPTIWKRRGKKFGLLKAANRRR